MKKNFKVLITAGGTGGHVFPALSIAEELINKKTDVVMISDQRVKKIIFKNKKLFKKSFIKFYILNFSNNLLNLFRNLSSFLNIFFILLKEKPNIIIGFGGYTSFPVLLAAKILFKPIILHEQNIVIGFANKLFLPFSKKIILGLGDDNKKSSLNKKKYFLIRNPVRKEILRLRKKINFKFKNKIYLLIIGGSQGSIALGEIFPKAFNLLSKDVRKNLFVYHQCLAKNLQKIKRQYKKMNLKADCRVFFEDLPKIMFKSHLVISRSGASSLSEISALGKPAILIPYKFSKDDHQMKNAKWFVKKGCGSIIEEKKLNVKTLKEKIELHLKDFKKLENMAKKSYLLGDPNASKKILNLIYNV